MAAVSNGVKLNPEAVEYIPKQKQSFSLQIISSNDYSINSDQFVHACHDHSQPISDPATVSFYHMANARSFPHNNTTTPTYPASIFFSPPYYSISNYARYTSHHSHLDPPDLSSAPYGRIKSKKKAHVAHGPDQVGRKLVYRNVSYEHHKKKERGGHPTSSRSGHGKNDVRDLVSKGMADATAGNLYYKKRHDKAVSYELNPDENNTTVMIRNIPSKYTREMLLEFLDEQCATQNKLASANCIGVIGMSTRTVPAAAFDFLYLPIDFKTGMNKGYAFVNFTSVEAVWKFYDATDNQTWDLCNSSKVRKIVRARIQGKEELKRHFKTTQFPCEDEKVLPVCFSPPRDGSNHELLRQTTTVLGTRIGQTRARFRV